MCRLTPFKIWISSLFLVLAWSFVSCHLKSVEEKKLAKTYCASFHLLPSPSLLPKNAWKQAKGILILRHRLK
jgi:hypothetical protein